MLVRFHSDATGAVTMFGDVAKELLLLMGASGVIPGALLAADVPAALRRLSRAVESPEGNRVLRQPRSSREETDDEQEEAVALVNLRTRAYPLLRLLETAAAEQCAVVWEDSSKATG
ncbi:MAG: hypothetical protein A3G25_18025 [Betaproteobacteria bacterium RIFCSPLOWO2_12_FULL_63_13]|nr:MAG: hypothetical protein A3H32_12170 [Betaproteobacteria bacterium RIFCSPLOWO2_02_FULL_63_19]OGA45445.1 MAG: hypothetical protein A3G25_18025 [Betaproteobacteria bacterium RIFCSPLOWO2_12_FULL_63_13]